jgi:endoglucanase
LTHRDTGHPINTGFYSAINNQELCRCHHLTNDQKYLEAAILSAQFACGANPMNLSFTSGLGINTIYRPLHQDSKVTGQKTPIGTTVNAQIDHQFYSRLSNNGQAGLQKQNEAWAKYQLAVKQNIPSGKQWPPHEAYYGFSSLPLINGYTIHHVFGPINYAFGYLAGKYYSRTID